MTTTFRRTVYEAAGGNLRCYANAVHLDRLNEDGMPRHPLYNVLVHLKDHLLSSADVDTLIALMRCRRVRRP